MTHHKKYKNESQDARRHDQQSETHPYEKKNEKQSEVKQNPRKSMDRSPNSKK